METLILQWGRDAARAWRYYLICGENWERLALVASTIGCVVSISWRL